MSKKLNTINPAIEKAFWSDKDKPIFISIASTGIEAQKDRICKLSLLNSEGFEQNFLINPNKEIQDYATKVHGIKNTDVKDSMPFEDVAEVIIKELEAHNIFIAYNFLFTFQILQNELYRTCGYKLLEENFTFIDPYLIFKKAFPYTLKNAFKLFLGKEFEEDEHLDFSASSLKNILAAQIQEFPQLFAGDLRELEHQTIGQIGVPGRWFSLKDEHFCFAQGKFKGKKINENHVDYLHWIASLEDISVSERKFIDDYCESVKVLEKSF